MMSWMLWLAKIRQQDLLREGRDRHIELAPFLVGEEEELLALERDREIREDVHRQDREALAIG